MPFCPSERRSLARALLLVSWTTLIAVVVVVVGCIEEEVVSGKERWMEVEERGAVVAERGSASK